MWKLDESINASPKKNKSIHKLRLLRKCRRKMEDLYWDADINQEFVSKHAPRITSDLSIHRFKEQYLLNNADRCKYENQKHSFRKNTRLVRNFQNCADIEPCETSTTYETCESNASNSLLNDDYDDELLLACLKAENESKSTISAAAPRTIKNCNTVSEKDCGSVRNFKNCADNQPYESLKTYETFESNASNSMLNDNNDDELLLACLKAEKESKSIKDKNFNRDCGGDDWGDFSFKSICNKKPNSPENFIDMHSKPIDKYSLHNTSKTDAISSKVFPDSSRLVQVCRRKITYDSNAGYGSKDGVGNIRSIQLSQNIKIAEVDEKIESQPGMKIPVMENETCWKDDWKFFVNFQTEDAFKLPPTQSEKRFNENFSDVPKTGLKPNYCGKFQMASRKEIKISEKALKKAEALIEKYGTAQENIDITEAQKPYEFFVEQNVPTNCFPASTSSNVESLGTELSPTSKNLSFQTNKCVGNIEACAPIEFDQGQNSLYRKERKLTNVIEGTALKKVKLAHHSQQFLDRNTFLREEEFRGFHTASKKYISISNDAKLRAATFIRESSECLDYDILKPQPTSKPIHPLEQKSNERDLEVCKRNIKAKRSSPKLDLTKLKRDCETDTAKTADNASTNLQRSSSNDLVHNATDCLLQRNFVRNISTKICSSSLLSSNACRPSGLRCRSINIKK